MVTGGSGVSMIYRVPYWSISNGGWSCLQDAEWLLSTNSSWWGEGVEKWQWKLCRMANQYCIYAQRGDSIAHLPEQQGFHRYIPADFWGKIMNISLFRATKTERSILMGENSGSWKTLLNNYLLSDIVLSDTPPASKYLLTKTHLVHRLAVSSIPVDFVLYLNMSKEFFSLMLHLIKLKYCCSTFLFWGLRS